MVIASIIIGILLIIGGFSCMAAPVDAYMRAAHMLAILLFVYGVYGIVSFFKKRLLVPEFIVSILAVVIGFVYLFRPGGTPPAGNLIGLDRVVLFLIAAWFLIKGMIFLVFSIRTRFINRRWIWGFIVGVLSILLGIYSFAEPVLAAASTGTLIGFFFIECGVDLLVFGLVAGFVTGRINDVRNNLADAVEEVHETVRSAAEDLKEEASAFREEVTAKAIENAADTAEEAPKEASDAAVDNLEDAVRDFIEKHEE